MSGVHASAQNARVEVIMRLRPPPKGKEDNMVIRKQPDQPTIMNICDSLNPNAVEREFAFDNICHTEASQNEVFEITCKPLVDHALEGFNGCCFAYGQTGSGKTYSIFGEHGDSRGAKRGIIPRAVEYLFSVIEKRRHYSDIAIFVSFLEIYLDHIGDLGKIYLDRKGLKSAQRPIIGAPSSSQGVPSSPSSVPVPRPMSAGGSGKPPVRTSGIPSSALSSSSISASGGSAPAGASSAAPPLPSSTPSRMNVLGPAPGFQFLTPSLEIHELPNGQVFVKDLSLIPVKSTDDIMEIIEAGVSSRATFETRMNEYSSRSHTVFTINIIQTDRRSAYGETVSGCLNLVDLAGSERLKRSESEGQRLKEAVVINKSLSALGNVILGIDKKDPHIPYRDSKLTRILQDSLGGNSFTTLLATLNPAWDNYEECLATLQFAHRCKSVQNQPRVNYMDVSVEHQERRIRKLQLEIANLQGQLVSSQESYQKQLEDLRQQFMQQQQVQATLMAQQQQAGVAPGGPGMGRGSVKRLDKAEKEKRHLLDKLEHEKGVMKSLQDAMRAEQSKQSSTLESYREKVLKLANQLEVGRHELMHAIEQLSLQHEEEVRELAARNHQLLEEQSRLVREIPDALKVNSDLLKNQRDLIAIGREEATAELKGLLHALDYTKDEVMMQQRTMYEELLRKRNDEIADLEKQCVVKVEIEKEKNRDLKKQLKYLYEYTKKLTHIVENVENGSYPGHLLRSGIKAVRVPDLDKPGPLDLDQCNYLKKCLRNANQLISDMSSGQTPQLPSWSSLGPSSAPSSARGVSASASFNSAFQPSPIAHASSLASTPSMASSASSSPSIRSTPIVPTLQRLPIPQPGSQPMTFSSRAPSSRPMSALPSSRR